MTEQELRELDAWIAEHLFGWKWWQFKRSEQEWCELIDPLSTWPASHKQYGGKIVDAKPVGLEDDSRPHHYSTDRAASQEVLERCMVGKSIVVESYGDFGAYWLVGSERRLITTADTFPLCIALFAKKLFGKE